MNENTATLKIEGMDELKKKLRKLDYRQQKNIVAAGLRAGAAVVRKEARAKVSKRTGAGRKGIVTKVSRKGNKVVARVGFRKEVFYLRFLEEGTIHQGAKPFLRPAIDENRPRVVLAITDKMAERIKKALGI